MHECISPCKRAQATSLARNRLIPAGVTCVLLTPVLHTASSLFSLDQGSALHSTFIMLDVPIGILWILAKI
jgi:hypothetical protein